MTICGGSDNNSYSSFTPVSHHQSSIQYVWARPQGQDEVRTGSNTGLGRKIWQELSGLQFSCFQPGAQDYDQAEI